MEQVEIQAILKGIEQLKDIQSVRTMIKSLSNAMFITNITNDKEARSVFRQLIGSK